MERRAELCPKSFIHFNAAHFSADHSLCRALIWSRRQALSQVTRCHFALSRSGYSFSHLSICHLYNYLFFNAILQTNRKVNMLNNNNTKLNTLVTSQATWATGPPHCQGHCTGQGNLWSSVHLREGSSAFGPTTHTDVHLGQCSTSSGQLWHCSQKLHAS